MCGISLIIGPSESCVQNLEFTERMKQLLSSRGPDCVGCYEARVPGQNWYLSAFGSTLWTQGSSPCKQPLSTERGSFLLWNGDAYNYHTTTKCQSDSHFMLNKIEEKGNPQEALKEICGPYAFIYYDPNARSVWFGRDPIGRCSLVLGLMQNEEVISISSVLPSTVKCAEISSQGIYQLELSSSSYDFIFHPWFDTLSSGIPTFPIATSVREATSHNVLQRCHQLDTRAEPTAEEVYSSSSNVRIESSHLEILKSLASREKVASQVDELIELLQAAVEVRVAVKPKLCKDCPTYSDRCSHSKIGILFSGGLDSTILAVMAHKTLDPNESIDLYNVAFDKSSSGVSKVPDRMTGYVALKELRYIAPNRKWNFVKIDVKESQLNGNLHHVADLIHPLNTVLDESLGCALWFAASGEGLVDSSVFKSSARVVLVGMGADELFGGYSRHAKQLNTGSWADLGALLAKEVLNIGSRNLGRDNRVVSDHGRMMRAPFLDENFISYVSALPPWVRCCPNAHLPRGVGDKTLLRLVALKLGLEETAVQPKRALQFGSRIANPKQKGHEVSSRLVNSS